MKEKQKEIDAKKLLHMANEAREKAYVPYSGFAVGAALLTADGVVYTGCNVENASYGVTNCAERTAFFKAVSEGVREFTAIAIVGGKAGEQSTGMCQPCGVCRQVMAEFCNPERFLIVLEEEQGESKGYLLKELLPLSFGAASM